MNQIENGFVVAGPNFLGCTLSFPNSFASNLYGQLGNPPVLFSCGSGNNFTLENHDENLISTNSTTMTQNMGHVDNKWQPTITFVVSQTSPPQFTLYG